MIDTLFHYPGCPLSSKLHCFYIPLFMSSHFCFMSFIKGHKIRHIYYCLPGTPILLRITDCWRTRLCFQRGFFAHTHAFREVAWSLLCGQVFTSSDNWHRRITVSASVLVAAHSWAEWAFVLPVNGYQPERANIFGHIEGFFFFFPDSQVYVTSLLWRPKKKMKNMIHGF